VQTEPAGAHWWQSAVQLAPVVFVSGAQVALAPVPHRWKPVLHAGTHVVPLQLTVPLAGAVQVKQFGPQAALLSLVTQVGLAVLPRRQ
jgi:hypothetical protein